MRPCKHILLPTVMLLGFSILLGVQFGCVSGLLDHCGGSHGDKHRQSAHQPSQSDPCQQDYYQPVKPSLDPETVVALDAPCLEPDPAAASRPDSRRRLHVSRPHFDCSPPGTLPLLA